MNKSDLINAVANDAELSKAAAGRAVDSVLAQITATIANGDTVALVGFGTFKGTDRAERKGKNPKTGEALTIAATRVPTFKAGLALKAAVAGVKVGKQ